MDKNLFNELGFSKNEEKVYLELIKGGKLRAAEISSRSGVPYGKIYVVLNSLVQKGLAKIIPEKTKKYSPADPKHLMKIINEKEKIFKKAREKVEELEQFYDRGDQDFLIIGEGDKGFWKIAGDLKTPEKYGYNIRWDSKILPGSLEKTRKAVKRGIDTRDLSRYDKETEKNVKKWLKVKPRIRKFPNEGVALSVLDDEEVMIGLIKKNTTLLIRDKAFAKVMKNLFLGAYENAEKISLK